MTDTTNGWRVQPGVPFNPEKDGWHWLENKYTGDRRANLWLTDLHWGLRSPIHEVGKACTYLGPCLTPDEATALQARVAELEGALRPFAELGRFVVEHHPDPETDLNHEMSALVRHFRNAHVALEGKKDE